MLMLMLLPMLLLIHRPGHRLTTWSPSRNRKVLHHAAMLARPLPQPDIPEPVGDRLAQQQAHLTDRLVLGAACGFEAMHKQLCQGSIKRQHRRGPNSRKRTI